MLLKIVARFENQFAFQRDTVQTWKFPTSEKVLKFLLLISIWGWVKKGKLKNKLKFQGIFWINSLVKQLRKNKFEFHLKFQTH